MLVYIQDLRRKGSTVSSPPKKPTRELPISFKKPSKLVGQELDQYLKKKLFSNYCHESEIPGERTFESLKLHLIKRAESTKKLNWKCLRLHLEHGKLFEKFYGL